MEKKKSNSIALLVMLLLCLAGLVMCIYIMIKYKAFSSARFIISIINYVGILFYGFYGYRIPHGNLLKYLMMLYAVNISCIGIYAEERRGVFYTTCMILAALLISYFAGRLDRVRANAIFAVIILAFIAAGIIYAVITSDRGFSAIILIGSSGFIVQWLAIASAYFTRYAAHKEAGLQDAARKSK